MSTWHLGWSKEQAKKAQYLFRFASDWFLGFKISKLIPISLWRIPREIMYVSMGCTVIYDNGDPVVHLRPSVVGLKYVAKRKIDELFKFQGAWPADVWFWGKIGSSLAGTHKWKDEDQGGYVPGSYFKLDREMALEAWSVFPGIQIPADPAIVRQLAEKLNDVAFCMEHEAKTNKN